MEKEIGTPSTNIVKKLPNRTSATNHSTFFILIIRILNS